MAAAAPRRVKLAFVGCGVISHHHLAAILSPLAADASGSPRITVAVLIDPSSENRAKLAGEVEAKTGSRPGAYAPYNPYALV